MINELCGTYIIENKSTNSNISCKMEWKQLHFLWEQFFWVTPGLAKNPLFWPAFFQKFFFFFAFLVLVYFSLPLSL